MRSDFVFADQSPTEQPKQLTAFQKRENMLENLRRKSLVKTYNDPIHQVHFEQGHASYEESFSVAQYKQRLAKDKTKKFPNTISFITKASFKIPCVLDGVRFNMIYCPSGTFEMGHEDEDENNKPRQETIEKPFILGETEVTQELFERVFPSEKAQNPQNPLQGVYWEGAIAFCNELSRLQGLDKCYRQNLKTKRWSCDFDKNGYRLPEGKEWEYAAKAGTNNRWAGTDNEDELVDYAWYKKNSPKTTQPVKTKKPNEWGFYDMSGNVAEWCWDEYGIPKYGTYKDLHMLRGGGVEDINEEALLERDVLPLDSPIALRSACPLYSYDSGSRVRNLGFRVCRSFID